MNPSAKCEDCRYWKRYETTGWQEAFTASAKEVPMIYGQCRFNAPIAVDGQVGHHNQFPLTNPEDWCGKFESKTQTQESKK
jgi:hypothetical protein